MNFFRTILKYIKDFFLFLGLLIILIFWFIFFIILIIWDMFFGGWKKVK